MRWEPEQQQNESITQGAVVSAYGERSQAAARDINNVSCQTAVLQLAVLARKPESQLQAEFAARTGILCSKQAREWLETLMEHHGFTSKELRRAWQCGSIGWSTKRDERYISTPWMELVVGYVYFGGLSIVFFLPWLVWLMSAQPRLGGKEMLALLACGAVYLGLIWLLANFNFLPRSVGLRIRRVEKRATSDQASGPLGAQCA